ncbi:hypothetical protein [Methyloceanibacter sp. wino2]|uniref:hypothetical protein n=1 Tax=Methyloceanibacter sp. wino2 TaxID=2170729 RepID=UPI000D3E9B72|nr:hypothetical protein [Methyloceanibacter sp. wino2]
MTDKTYPKETDEKSEGTEGHLGQVRAREEKQSEEMLKELGGAETKKTGRDEPPKLGDDKAEREKRSDKKLKNM